METIERILRDHPFLRGLRAEWLRFIVGCAANVRFQAGEFLLREGGSAREMYLLRRGRVALEIDVPGRGPVAIETLEPGDVLGISWVHAPYRWSLDARAVDTVIALGFDAACLRDKMEADPAFGFQLTRRLLMQVTERLKRVRLQRVDLYRAEP